MSWLTRQDKWEGSKIHASSFPRVGFGWNGARAWRLIVIGVICAVDAIGVVGVAEATDVVDVM